MCTVSIIIPTRNRADMLAEALKSVLAQTYRSWEALVIDDGSTDLTPQVIQRFAVLDQRIRGERLEGGGVSAARNAGLDEARGRFVAFLDDDDLWLPNKLELQVERMEREPALSLIYGQAIVEDAQGRCDGLKPSAWVDGNWRWLVESNFLPTCTVMVRASCIGRVRFDEQLLRAQDYDFFLRLTKKTTFAGIRQPLAIYRRHANNATAHMGSLQYACHVRTLKKLFRQRDLSVAEREVAVHRLAREWHLLGKALFLEQRYREAASAFASAIRTAPAVGMDFVEPSDGPIQQAVKFLKPYAAVGYSLLASLRRVYAHHFVL